MSNPKKGESVILNRVVIGIDIVNAVRYNIPEGTVCTIMNYELDARSVNMIYSLESIDKRYI